MRVALVSLNQFWEDKEINKRSCDKFIKESSEKKVDLVIFPEMTLTGFSVSIKTIAETIQNSESISWFSKQAVKYSMQIIFGVVLWNNEKARNHLIFVDKDGTVIENYAKIHPFSFSEENKYFDGGDNISFTNILGTTIGFTICYDLRFPELYQALSKNCEIIINIANWPKRRVEHWRTLLKARAIENQIYMIGVNRTGVDGNGLEYEKSSLIFAPDGMLVKPLESNEQFDIVEFDISEVKKFRESFPVKKDRKIEFYKRIL